MAAREAETASTDNPGCSGTAGIAGWSIGYGCAPFARPRRGMDLLEVEVPALHFTYQRENRVQRTMLFALIALKTCRW